LASPKTSGRPLSRRLVPWSASSALFSAHVARPRKPASQATADGWARDTSRRKLCSVSPREVQLMTLAFRADPAVIGKLPNLLRRHRTNPLVESDRTACASALTLRRRIEPELPGGLRVDRGYKEAERRDPDRVHEIPRSSTESHDDEQETDERHRRLTEPQHGLSMCLPPAEIHRRTGGGGRHVGTTPGAHPARGIRHGRGARCRACSPNGDQCSRRRSSNLCPGCAKRSDMVSRRGGCDPTSGSGTLIHCTPPCTPQAGERGVSRAVRIPYAPPRAPLRRGFRYC
jgi:hypothetical protein